MSLHTAAQHLASKGRNGDSMLIHMTKDEVKGLAALAKAHGTHLTKNPETGLPEAFKLGKVLQAALPIAAGFALGPAGFGLMSAAGAGLAVGGAYALATGSLEKGLMAGLGAWGGGSLGGASAGTASTTGSLTGPAATTVATPTAASLTAPLTSSAAAAPTAFAAQPTVAGLTAAPAAGGFGISATPGASSTLGSIAAPANALTYQAATPGIGSSIAGFAKNNPWTTVALIGGPLLAGMEQKTPASVEASKGMIRPYTFKREVDQAAFKQPADGSTAERNYFASQKYTPLPAYEAAEGGQVPRYEQMAPGGLAAIQGLRDGYGAMQTTDGNIPQFAAGGYTYDKDTQRYSESTPPEQLLTRPGVLSGLGRLSGRGLAGGIASSVVNPQTYDQSNNAVGAYLADGGARYLPKFTYDPITKRYVDVTPAMPAPIEPTPVEADPNYASAQGGKNGGLMGYAAGGISSLGGYSDGGRLLKGPGDGVSDSIPATINNKQPAKLADGEFVVPARIVSEIGNGSTDAGARKLYAMMDRVQNRRKKTVGKGKVAVNTKAEKDLPA